MPSRSILLRTAVLATVATTMLIPATDARGRQGSAGEVTFYKDVMPVLQDNCLACHRPGEMAPMSFMTYDDVRPWARAIRQAVITRAMPPWFAEPSGHAFLNDRRLGDAEMRTLVSWAENGAPSGDPADAP